MTDEVPHEAAPNPNPDLTMSNATHALTLLTEMLNEPSAMDQIMAETRRQGASDSFIQGLSKFLTVLQDRDHDPERVKETLQREVSRIRDERTGGEGPGLPELKRADEQEPVAEAGKKKSRNDLGR